jgi:hypothetical protein
MKLPKFFVSAAVLASLSTLTISCGDAPESASIHERQLSDAEVDRAMWNSEFAFKQMEQHVRNARSRGLNDAEILDAAKKNSHSLSQKEREEFREELHKYKNLKDRLTLRYNQILPGLGDFYLTI